MNLDFAVCLAQRLVGLVRQNSGHVITSIPDELVPLEQQFGPRCTMMREISERQVLNIRPG